jgi:serine/threonine-protein kinase
VGHVGFSRIVAVKRLHPQYSKDQEFVSMFEDEARLASRIQHPNVVSTLDVVKTRDELFVVMEYVQGEPLSRLVRNAAKRGERIPPHIVTSVMAGMLHGLHAAHEAKSETREPLSLVHRDISPQNVLVGVDGVARVLDFGVAKAALRSGATRDGQMKGKLSYMSPEQLNGKEIDRRTDIFAAGVVTWEALAGKRLFAGADAGEILAKVLSSEIPSPQSVVPTLPDALNAVVMKALDRDPDNRFQTAREFAVALEQTGQLATSHTVGEWVREYGGEELIKRINLVTEVESYPMEDLEERRSGVESFPQRPGDTDPTKEYLKPQSTPNASSSGWKQRVVAAGLFLLLGMLGGWVLIQSILGGGTEERTIGSGPARTPPSEVSAKARQPEGPPVGVAASSAEVGAELAAASAAAALDNAGTQNPGAGASSAVGSKPGMPAVLPPGSLSHQRLPIQPPRGPLPRAKDCSVPYTVDANGIKIPKAYCLKR